jgi:hypothetical protein
MNMNRFVLKSIFTKINMYHFSINIFYKNKKSNLCFGDYVAVQNNLNYRYIGSMNLQVSLLTSLYMPTVPDWPSI